MVWGMAEPGAFGAFFPRGEHVGWKEGLIEYFDNKMPSDQKARFPHSHSSSYVSWVAANFVNEPGARHGPDNPPFGPIAAHEAPTRYKTKRNFKALGSLITTYWRLWAVDERLKSLIERFEPGVHHFFPIEIEMPSKLVYPEKYFIMVIGQYLDSFLPEQSDPSSWMPDLDEYCTYINDKQFISGLALSKNRFGKAHLWREHRLSNALLCFSDELISEIKRSGLRLPEHFRLKEIVDVSVR